MLSIQMEGQFLKPARTSGSHDISLRLQHACRLYSGARNALCPLCLRPPWGTLKRRGCARTGTAPRCAVNAPRILRHERSPIRPTACAPLPPRHILAPDVAKLHHGHYTLRACMPTFLYIIRASSEQLPPSRSYAPSRCGACKSYPCAPRGTPTRRSCVSSGAGHRPRSCTYTYRTPRTASEIPSRARLGHSRYGSADVLAKLPCTKMLEILCVRTHPLSSPPLFMLMHSVKYRFPIGTPMEIR
ncbi:hypothetical protein FB451DRAFT_1280105 [Mycena latifolia]|nr:hypothetical protein FB451DRAFT_1280105 [Mycena latifolia]